MDFLLAYDIMNNEVVYREVRLFGGGNSCMKSTIKNNVIIGNTLI